MEDLELIQDYLKKRSQAAFTELVKRHVNLVYSAAVRQVGRAHAEDVSQAVFLELARKARQLRADTNLATWLYVVTRRTAVDLIRREVRRLKREQAAAFPESLAMETPTEPDWNRLSPHLDEAMSGLSDDDRRAIIMRYFENCRIRDIGVAFHSSEDAAQKRVTRALDKLRSALASRGLAAGSAMLAAELSAHAVESAPPGLGAALGALVVKPVVSTGGWLAATAGTAVLAGSIVFAVIQMRSANAESIQLASLERQLALSLSDVSRSKTELDSVRPAAVGYLKKSDGQLALRKKAETLVARVIELRKYLGSNPGRNIPEMRLLSDKDWMEVARNYPLFATDADFRKALSDLRRQAKEIFAQRMLGALQKFSADKSGALPTDVLQLAPYFDPPADIDMLQRYSVIPHSVSNSGTIGEKPSALVDDVYENATTVGARGYSSTGSGGPSDPMEFPLRIAISRAREAYRGDHGGKGKPSPQDLVPYFESSAAAAKYLATLKATP